MRGGRPPVGPGDVVAELLAAAGEDDTVPFAGEGRGPADAGQRAGDENDRGMAVLPIGYGAAPGDAVIRT
jgi:hypothetical protein